ncbi:MAG: type I-C CRISPR-associated protein Cas8c/Csd1 [Bacillota bacterium]|nr:type I-C CRISPR-associated protein Cas8c/Csd1 [Bacillota bacterium]
MILQSLVSYYEALAAKGEIPRPGWATVKVAYALEIDENGRLLRILPLKTLSGDEKIMEGREMVLPAPVKRTVGIASNFLWDNAIYLLGFNSKDDAKRSKLCFEAAKELHLKLLRNCPDEFAKAVYSFFNSWRSETANSSPLFTEVADDLAKGANLTFMFNGQFPADNKTLCAIWQDYYDGEEDGFKMCCLVTGKSVVPALVHPSIKGVRGAQSSGAAIESFNERAYESYGRFKGQGLNAPVSKYAAFAYTTALNHLIAQKDDDGRSKAKLIGDTTMVFWAEDAGVQYQNAFVAILDGEDNTVSNSDLETFIKAISSGGNADWDGLPIKPDNHFYILGLAPNAARLSVRFFLRDSFGSMVKHIKEHYDRLEIVSDNHSKWKTIPLWALLQETVNKNSRDKAPSPQMAGDTLRAILSGGQYPATLYQQTQLRIRAERDVSRGQAAIIKAYIIRNTDNEKIKEAATVALNEQTDYTPYVLGRLFSVLENIQDSASGASTVKDRFFNSACATPAAVFPQLLKLKNSHMKVLMREKPGIGVTLEKLVTELLSMLDNEFPKHFLPPEQGAFILGYYHQTQKRYEKKNMEKTEEVKENV